MENLSRMENNISSKLFPVSWDQFHRDSKALAWRLADKADWSAIIAVTRGGLVPSAIVARELNVRIIETICVTSYNPEHKKGDIEVLKRISDNLLSDPKFKPDTILCIDDLVDTGSTMAVVKDMIPGAHVATVYAKPEGLSNVDTFVTEVSQDTWIYFPWDTELQFSPPINPGGV